MRKYIFLAVLTIITFSCAKKTVPVSSTISTPAMEVPAPDAVKINAAKTVTTEVTTGHELYTAKCAKCHELKKVDDYTSDEWTPIVERMAPKARLDSAGKANILAYVQFYSKHS